MAAEQQAPEETYARPAVKSLISGLLVSGRTTPELRGLAARAGSWPDRQEAGTPTGTWSTHSTPATSPHMELNDRRAPQAGHAPHGPPVHQFVGPARSVHTFGGLPNHARSPPTDRFRARFRLSTRQIRGDKRGTHRSGHFGVAGAAREEAGRLVSYWSVVPVSDCAIWRSYEKRRWISSWSCSGDWAVCTHLC